MGPTVIGLRRFDRLTRVDFDIFNRRTREKTRFSASFSPDAVGLLPVQIVFQPSFWLRVELRLDEAADVPSDPAADAATLARMREVCSGASQRATQTAIGVRTPSPPRNWRR